LSKELVILSSAFKKAWYDCFLDHHDLTGKDDVPAVDTKKSWEVWKTIWKFFSKPLATWALPAKADEVKRYCKAARISKLSEKALGKAERN